VEVCSWAVLFLSVSSTAAATKGDVFFPAVEDTGSKDAGSCSCGAVDALPAASLLAPVSISVAASRAFVALHGDLFLVQLLTRVSGYLHRAR
jgi:hypothetical protein